MSDPPRVDNPPGAPPVDVPAAAPPDRAATEAARMEAERLRLVEAIVIIVIILNILSAGFNIWILTLDLAI